MRKVLQKMSLLGMLLMLCIGVKAADVTATWNFRSGSSFFDPTFIYQGTTATLDSDVAGIQLEIDATSGKFSTDGRTDWAQFNSGTILKVPVKTTKDIVTVNTYSKNKATIGGVDVATDQTSATEHKATTAEVAAGFVEIVATANDYVGYITVTHVDPLQEKAIYKTDFSEWSEAADTDPATVISKKTRLTNETLNFSLFKTKVMATDDGKFSAYTTLPRMTLRAEKNAGSYITTSALANISKVRYIHGATGSSRGWKLEAKGDGDEDWVVISDAYASPNAWSEVTKEVNKTNVQLRWTNLAAAQNAFMFELDIYGMVDMTQLPLLGSFKVNGVQYFADDIFDMDEKENYVATIELSKKVEMVDETNNPLADIVAANGEITSVTYTPANDGTSCKVTFVVEANGKTATYIATFVQKPDFTLTYLNTDGSEMGTQIVEKDATIDAFAYDFTTAIAGKGQKVRGWFEKVDGGHKFTIEDVITANTTLYAVATEIEEANTTARYYYTLTDKNFYAEDHECFNPEGSGVWHDAQHGWVFASGDKINVPVGGDANLIFGLCQYSGGNAITVTDANGAVVGTIENDKASSDATPKMVSYQGGATTLTITFSGTSYLHTLTVANIADKPVQKEGSWFTVETGDAVSLLNTIDVANATNSETTSERAFIFVPNGTYDLGTIVLSCISGSNISLIGESVEGTIIVNAPKRENEGIGTTATLMNTGSNNYFEDITLKNALDYYGAVSAGQAGGRAVCLWDKGTNTICKRVKMLSYQDTYYSNNDAAKFYWEDSEIHGTVDFICGGGDVLFENTKIYVEPRKKDGSGECTITAPTTKTEYGYVFNNCTIENHAAAYNLGRAWQNTPKAVYLNTKMNQQPITDRWTLAGMTNNDMAVAAEYNSQDMEGNDVTPPAGTTRTFKNKGTVLTIVLTDNEAAQYTSANMFGAWQPDAKATAAAAPKATIENGVITIVPADGGDAGVYLIERNGEFVKLTSETEVVVEENNSQSFGMEPTYVITYTVRAANAMGGFGEAAVATDPTAVENISANDNADAQANGAFVINGNVVIMKDGKQFTAAGARIK